MLFRHLLSHRLARAFPPARRRRDLSLNRGQRLAMNESAPVVEKCDSAWSDSTFVFADWRVSVRSPARQRPPKSNCSDPNGEIAQWSRELLQTDLEVGESRGTRVDLP
jgi:hypothetical protein